MLKNILDRVGLRSQSAAVAADAGQVDIQLIGTSLKQVNDQGVATDLGGGTGAPTDATYIVQTPHASLSAEQALSALASGLLFSTTVTGVLTIATVAQILAALNTVQTARGTDLPDLDSNVAPGTDKAGRYVIPASITAVRTYTLQNTVSMTQVKIVNKSSQACVVKRQDGTTIATMQAAVGAKYDEIWCYCNAGTTWSFNVREWVTDA